MRINNHYSAKTLLTMMGAVLFCFSVGWLFYGIVAHAETTGGGWMDRQLIIGKDVPVEGSAYCYERDYRYISTPDYAIDRQTCVIHGSEVDFSLIGKSYYVSRPGEPFYYITGVPIGSLELIDETDTAIHTPRLQDGTASLAVFGSFSRHLIAYTPTLERPLYRIVDPKIVYPRDGAGVTNVLKVGHSDNGRYVVYSQKVESSGLLRYVFVDLLSGEDRVVGYDYMTDPVRIISPISMLKVSNDGRFIVGVKSSKGLGLKFWNVSECGVDTTTTYEAGQQPCESHDILLTEDYGVNCTSICSHDAFSASSLVEFSSDTLRYLYTNDTGQLREMTIHPTRYYDDKLTYLALGDSYSSGEGDIIKVGDGWRGSYMAETNKAGGCHLSPNSYPFLLRAHYGISETKMKSVACSGAKVLPDYFAPLGSYVGQSRQLASMDVSAREARQKNAIDLFRPGEVPQLEFVRRYHPRFITLTAGGNDVGFGNVLEYCARITPGEVVAGTTCGYAKENNDLRSILGASIKEQFSYTVMLIEKMKNASPESTIYLIGYPSFVADWDATCMLNAGFLNSDERTMINWGVRYLNQILEQAARASGAVYIDIEDSLAGGRLCEGSDYTTGVVDIDFNLSNQQMRQGIFHPNARGQGMMKTSILRNDNFSLAVPRFPRPDRELQAPDIPDYFKGLSNAPVKAKKSEMVSYNQAVRGEAMQLTLPSSSFAPYADVGVFGYSDPVSLGAGKTRADGSFSADITIPDSMEPGMHVLVVRGKNAEGEEVAYYQFITIVESESSERETIVSSDQGSSLVKVANLGSASDDEDVLADEVSANSDSDQKSDVSATYNQSFGEGVNDKSRQKVEQPVAKFHILWSIIGGSVVLIGIILTVVITMNKRG